VTLRVYRNPKLLDFVQVCVGMQPDEVEQYEAFSGEKYDPESVAALFSLRDGPSWVIVADSKPVLVAGFDRIRNGVWQDWCISTPDAWGPHWHGVTRIVRRAMDAMLQDGAHRLQCISLASRIHAHRWYRPLGLVKEGVLHGYGANGEDAIMFARLRNPDGHE
jgi:hypothetical protein